MRKLAVLLVILAFVLAVGCVNQAAQPTQEPAQPAPVQPVSAPPMNQVNPAAENTPAQPTVPSAETPAVPQTPSATSEEVGAAQGEAPANVAGNVDATLGSRTEGTDKPAVDQEVPEGYEEIKLNADKTMSIANVTIAKGDTLYWKNYDTWPHSLAVESGKGWDVKRLARSDQLQEGGVWYYTFNDEGTFLVRDVYSGPMRMTVTVE